MSFTRREFIKASGALLATAKLVTPLSVVAAAAETSKKTGTSTAKIRYIKSTCAHCVNFCGINVQMENDVIRAIYPDPERAPYYNVGICPKGVSGVFNTYNPYRIKKPLKRTNPEKGLNQDPKWVEISWEEAFKTIADKLKTIRTNDPRKLIWQHGHGKYLIGDQFPKAFAKAFGTPNLIHRTTTCEAARHVADELTWGYHGFLPDVKNCNFLLNFGGNYFEAEQFARWLDHATTDAKERGMKIVVIEPRLSSTASKADEWIPVRPGKDVILLLGLARLLIENNTIDEDFLTSTTNATALVADDETLLKNEKSEILVWDESTQSAKTFAEDVKPALKGTYTVNGKVYKTAFQVFSDSLQDLSLAYISEKTGIPEKKILWLASELTAQAKIGASIMIDGQQLRYRPVAIHTFRGLSAKEFGVQNWRAGLILQMLLGNIDAVGGINLHDVYKKPKYFEPSKAEYPPQRVDLQESIFFPHATHNVAQQVAKTVLNPRQYGLEYTPEMQIFYATNRPFSTSNAKAQFASLTHTYNVVIELVMTETAQMADIVLPDLTYLESWHLSPTRYTPHTKHTAIRQPVTNAYQIPHDAYSILWELAKRTGILDDYVTQINKQWGLKKYPLQTGQDYTAEQAVSHLWQEKTKGKDFELAKSEAFIGKHLDTQKVYLSGVEAKFKGVGKPKMNFYAEQLVHTLNTVKQQRIKHKLRDINIGQYKLAMSPLPKKEHGFPVPHRVAYKYPYYLITYKRMFRNQSGNTALNPILNALGADVQENYVLINRQTAKKLKIDDGNEIVIETRVGKLQGKAKVIEGIRPDTIAISYHYGQQSLAFPEYAKGGMWVNSILESNPDVVSGMDSFNDSKCKVYKV